MPGVDFAPTDRCRDFSERLTAFMDEHVYPAEPVFEEQMAASGDPHFHPPIIEELKERGPQPRACGTSSTRTPSTGPG